MMKVVLTIFSVVFLFLYGTTQVLWSAPAGQEWLDNTNWATNAVPTATEVAQFGTAPASVTTGIGIDMNNPTNNGVNNQAVGAIEILNTRSGNLKIGNSSLSASGTFTLNGATINALAHTIIRNNDAGTLLIDNYQGSNTNQQTMSLALGNTTDNRIFIAAAGGVTINTVISGLGRTLSVYGTGTGTVQLNAANIYTGVTTVNGATLQLNNAGGGTLPASNDITINNGGTLRISTNQTINDLILNTGGSLVLDAGVVLTINGTFFHNGGNISGDGTMAYAVSASLAYGAAVPQTTTAKEFPLANQPFNLIINNPANVTLHESKEISGNLVLTIGRLILFNFNFSTFDIIGGNFNAYVVTNGSGRLTRKNVASPEFFPIGPDINSFNPIEIGNGTNGTSLDYAVKVDVGFTAAAIADPSIAVNRTWYVTSSATPVGSINTKFYYLGTAVDAGAGFSTTQPVDHAINLPLGYGWNVNQTNITQVLEGSYYTATASVFSFFNTFDFPMVIGNLNAILNTPRLVDLSAQKINNTAQLNWTNNTSAVFKEVVVERSANGRNFETLAAVFNSALSYTDNQLLAGSNYYRIKTTDINGRVFYSSIAAIINSATGFDIVSLMPNIVNTTAQLNITSAQKTPVNVVVTDMAGRPVLKQLYNAVAGSNLFTVNAAALPVGMYYVTATTATGEVKTVKFIKQ